MSKVKVFFVRANANERLPEKQDLSLVIEKTVNEWVKENDVDAVGVDVSTALTTQQAGAAIVTVLYKKKGSVNIGKKR